MSSRVRDHLADANPDALFCDGFDDALIGVAERFGMDPVALYDRDKYLAILIEGGASEEEAEEFFSYNVIGAWAGEGTPVFATLFSP